MRIAHIQGSNISVAHFTVLFPNTSFPPQGPDAEWMAQNNCMRVVDDKPHDTKTEKIVVVDPYIDGDKVSIVRVEPKTAQDLEQDNIREANKIRYERNKRLADSDWTQLSDSTVDKAAWAQYRQALRDVPSQQGFPTQVVWPSTP